MTSHNRRIIGVVRVDLLQQVEDGICHYLGDGYRGSFSIRLSPTGEEPATHQAGDAQCTEAERDAVVWMMDPSNGIFGFCGIAWGVETPETVPFVVDPGVLPEAPSTEWRWSLDAVLQFLGLKRIGSVPPTFDVGG